MRKKPEGNLHQKNGRCPMALGRIKENQMEHMRSLVKAV